MACNYGNKMMDLKERITQRRIVIIYSYGNSSMIENLTGKELGKMKKIFSGQFGSWKLVACYK